MRGAYFSKICDHKSTAGTHTEKTSVVSASKVHTATAWYC
jgi:hypothetical protein